PARQRRRLMRQHLGEITYAAPLLGPAVVDLAGLGVGFLRLDHFHARHGHLPVRGNVAEASAWRERALCLQAWQKFHPDRPAAAAGAGAFATGHAGSFSAASGGVVPGAGPAGSTDPRARAVRAD